MPSSSNHFSLNFCSFIPILSQKKVLKASRYGFNGKEKMNEITNIQGSDYDFGARMYEGRLGKFFSVDPLFKKYADYSPYLFSGNNPILFVDKTGKTLNIYYNDENGNRVAYKYGSGLKLPDNKFVQNTVLAIQQLEKVDVGAKLVDKIASSTTKTIDINESIKGAASFNFQPLITEKSTCEVVQNNTKVNVNDVEINSGVINFNPLASISFPEGAISPSTALGHELGHGFEAFYLTAQFLFFGSIKDKQYETFAEKFTIENFEHPIAQYYGEGLRNDHNGKEIYTISPTSIQEQTITPDQSGATGTQIQLPPISK